jgi:hypothetical protein
MKVPLCWLWPYSQASCGQTLAYSPLLVRKFYNYKFYKTFFYVNLEGSTLLALAILTGLLWTNTLAYLPPQVRKFYNYKFYKKNST